MKLAIIDYGMGNLRSVQKAFTRLGIDPLLTSDPTEIKTADALVLPGVGAFGDGIQNLKALGLDRPTLQHLEQGKPFLGICLGLQLLFEMGHENGHHRGLGWFPGEVVRFPESVQKGPSAVKVPHMGWNTIQSPAGARKALGFPEGSFFYFVHAYIVQPQDPSIILTTTNHGMDFVSSVRSGSLIATQFHPEKSQKSGAQFLRHFLEDIAGYPLAKELAQ